MVHNYHNKIRNPKFLRAFFQVTTSSALFCFFTLFAGAVKTNVQCEISDSSGSVNIQKMMTGNIEKNIETLKEDKSLNIGPFDEISCSVDKQTDLHSYHIVRAVKINVNIFNLQEDKYDNKLIEAKNGSMIFEALNVAGISIADLDEITLKMDGEQQEIKKTGAELKQDKNLIIKPGLSIKIDRVTYEEFTKEEEIPFTEELVEDSNMLLGRSRVECEGQSGLKQLTYKIKAVNGKRQGEPQQVGNEVIVKPPINKKIVKGIRMLSDDNSVIAAGGRRGSLRRSKSAPSGQRGVLEGFATHYNIGTHTSTGRRVRPGVIAVDPSKIPYGSTVNVYDKRDRLIYTGVADDYCPTAKKGKVVVDIYGANIGKIPVRVEWKR